jgi:hypothetical protein
LSEETRRKIGEAHRGKPVNQPGVPLKVTHRAAISRSLAGNQRGKGNRGKKLSEEHKRKIGEARRRAYERQRAEAR